MRAKALPLVLGLMLVGCVPAWAQAPDTVLLEELTWTEVRDLIKAGKTTILVPLGGTEQNGPHMALGKHNARVRALAEQIARGARRRPGGAGARLRAGGRAQSAHRAHALPGHHHATRGGVREGARVGRAELPAPRLPGHRVPRRLRAEPGGTAGGGGPAQPRVGGTRRLASMPARSTTGRRRGSSRDCFASGAIARTRSGSTRAWPTPR